MVITLELLAMILSVVAVIITVVGFFASLYFYRHGMSLQGDASRTLAKIEERTEAINTRVGGIFEKTLDAAIGARDVSANFNELQKQLDTAKDSIITAAVREIGDAASLQEGRLREIVDSKLSPVQRRVETAREILEEGVAGQQQRPLPPKSLHDALLLTLQRRRWWETAANLAQTLGIEVSELERVVQPLENRGFVETQLTLFDLEGEPPGAWRLHAITHRGELYVRDQYGAKAWRYVGPRRLTSAWS